MDIHAQIVLRIIKAQEEIIGPVAVEQALQVSGLKLDWAKRQVSLSGDKAAVIDRLVEKYQALFGQISVEVSKEATASLIGQLPKDKLPKALK